MTYAVRQKSHRHGDLDGFIELGHTAQYIRSGNEPTKALLLRLVMIMEANRPHTGSMSMSKHASSKPSHS